MSFDFVLRTENGPPLALASPEYNELVDALHAARAMCESGPRILVLLNDFILLCEEMLDYREASPPRKASACCPAALQFLDALVAHAENIRASNGQLDERFFDLIEASPLVLPRCAA